MQLMTRKNIFHTVRMMVLVMLFQLFSPAVFALTSESKENGYFSILCTTQGYKQVWIALNDEKDAEHTVFSCPYCSFSLNILDVINSNTGYYLDFVDGFTDDFLITQNKSQSEVLLKSLPIRAPPYFG